MIKCAQGCWVLSCQTGNYVPFLLLFVLSPESSQNHQWVLGCVEDCLLQKKGEKTTESKNTHKPHKTMISKAGPGSAMPDGKTGAGFLQNHLQSVPHRQLRKIRGFPGYPEAPIPGKLCYSISRKPLPCSVPDSSSLLGFRDTGEAAAANCPSATLNLKETPKKPLAKESLGKKKFQLFSSSSLWKTQLFTKCPQASTTVTAPTGQ